jgi:pyridoxal phosphate enzyme (YggS family)
VTLCYTERVSIVTSQVTIQERLHAVQQRIDTAARNSGRSASAVTLIAVTKTLPLELVREAMSTGVCDFGENRVQDLLQRLTDLQDPNPCRWHLIGHLQRNKARKAVQVGSTIHSIDSVELAHIVGRDAAAPGRSVDVFAQVNVSGERSKSGFSTDDLRSHAGELAAIPSLRWRGLMTIAPELSRTSELHSLFAALRELRDDLASTFDGGAWDSLSMGMSNDFDIAIEEGATHIRVGRAIFGDRPAPLIGGHQ